MGGSREVEEWCWRKDKCERVRWCLCHDVAVTRSVGWGDIWTMEDGYFAFIVVVGALCRPHLVY